MPKVLWGDEEDDAEPEPVKKKKRPVANYDLRQFRPDSTDITLWLRENKPTTLAECADLKKALKTKTTAKVGNYTVEVFGPKGSRVTHVRGPAGLVALKSVAARRLFKKRLASIEDVIETYLKQFGTETPDFETSKPLLDLD